MRLLNEGLDVLPLVVGGPARAPAADPQWRIQAGLCGPARVVGCSDERHQNTIGTGVQYGLDDDWVVPADADDRGDLRAFGSHDVLLYGFNPQRGVLCLDHDEVKARTAEQFRLAGVGGEGPRAQAVLSRLQFLAQALAVKHGLESFTDYCAMRWATMSQSSSS